MRAERNAAETRAAAAWDRRKPSLLVSLFVPFCMFYMMYEEFTRLAETRLAQNISNYISIA